MRALNDEPRSGHLCPSRHNNLQRTHGRGVALLHRDGGRTTDDGRPSSPTPYAACSLSALIAGRRRGLCRCRHRSRPADHCSSREVRKDGMCAQHMTRSKERALRGGKMERHPHGHGDRGHRGDELSSTRPYLGVCILCMKDQKRVIPRRSAYLKDEGDHPSLTVLLRTKS